MRGLGEISIMILIISSITAHIMVMELVINIKKTETYLGLCFYLCGR